MSSRQYCKFCLPTIRALLQFSQSSQSLLGNLFTRTVGYFTICRSALRAPSCYSSASGLTWHRGPVTQPWTDKVHSCLTVEMAELHVSGQIADAQGFSGSNLFCEVRACAEGASVASCVPCIEGGDGDHFHEYFPRNISRLTRAVGSRGRRLVGSPARHGARPHPGGPVPRPQPERSMAWHRAALKPDVLHNCECMWTPAGLCA